MPVESHLVQAAGRLGWSVYLRFARVGQTRAPMGGRVRATPSGRRDPWKRVQGDADRFAAASGVVAWLNVVRRGQASRRQLLASWESRRRIRDACCSSRAGLSPGRGGVSLLL